MMLRTTENGDEFIRSRRPLYAAVTITTIICAASFVLSFVALWDLCTKAGQPRELAWLFPVIIDGTILQATISVVSIAHAPGAPGRRDRRFFWMVLVVAATVSVAGNALHAWLSHSPGFSPIIAAAIATIAPVSLLGASHGLVVLSRRSDTPIVTTNTSNSMGSMETIGTIDTDMASDLPSDRGLMLVESSSDEDRRATEHDIEREATAPAAGGREFESAEQRKNHALLLHAQGLDVPEVAGIVGRSESTVYRWISQARERRPLVPQASMSTPFS